MAGQLPSLPNLSPKVFLVFADLFFQRIELGDTLVDLCCALLQEDKEFGKDLTVVLLFPVDLFQIDHLGEGEAQDLQAIDEFQASDIVVGEDPFPVLEPADALEEPDLFIVPDRTA
jgi:hypothetical protein